MGEQSKLSRRNVLAVTGAAGLTAIGMQVRAGEQSNEAEQKAWCSDEPELEKFRLPKDAKVMGGPEELRIAAASSIVGVAEHTFRFKKNGSGGIPPGQTHEDSIVVNVPAGAGFFVCTGDVSGSFVQSNLSTLSERPLGQFMIDVGMRGNNLVCRARLTDSNQDDPVSIWATAIVVFYR